MRDRVRQLSYVTRVNVPSRAAQATQIASMARAFGAELGAGFTLVCGGTLQPVGYVRRPLPFGRGQWTRYAAACLAAARAVLARRGSVVFTRDIGVAVAAVALGGQAVYEAHKEPKGSGAQRLMRWLAGHRRFRLVAISSALGRHYAEHYGVPAQRLLVAHDGVFPEDYPEIDGAGRLALRRELGLPEDRPVVVHTGSLYTGRGAELFEEVLRACPSVLFVQVGGEPEDIERWRQHYAGRDVPSPRFVERQAPDQVRKYQAAADLLFYMITRATPTYWCCSPLKLFEYMASGTPMLAARIGSLAEVIDDSNAYCFDPDRPESIRQAMACYLADPAAARVRAGRARAQACGDYSWGQRARNILAFALSEAGGWR